MELNYVPVTVWIPEEKADLLKKGQMIELQWGGHSCVGSTSKPKKYDKDLPDTEVWQLSSKQWDWFLEMLDAPAREVPKLHELMMELTVFDTEQV